MNSTQLNEHDAHQGAQSSGEFLGMTGNSGWYLLGSGGATIMMVILLWGVFGFSLLLCLFVGLLLCLGSLAYVFALKNNKPAHYDSDFFESALVESGVLVFRFGPRDRRPINPFMDGGDLSFDDVDRRTTRRAGRAPVSGGARRTMKSGVPATCGAPTVEVQKSSAARDRAKEDAVVARTDYEKLQEKLSTTEDLLEEALSEVAED